MKCMYCENEATRKDYRTWNGRTGKEFVCDECFELNNEGLLDRRSEIDKALKELDFYKVDSILDTGMGEFWDAVNDEVNTLANEKSEAFKDETGIEINEATLDEWRELMYDKISKTLKKQI